MSAFAPLAIRLFCDIAARNGTVTDLNTGEPACFYRGDDIEIDIGIGEGGTLLAPSLSNIVSVTCQVFARQNDTNSPMMSGTVAAAGMNLGLTSAEWTNNTAPFYHAAFVFTNAQTSISLGGEASQNYWLRILLQTGDSPAKTVTLLEGAISVLDGPVSTTPAAGPGNARFWTDNSGNVVLQLRNDSDGKFYSVGIENGAGGAPGLYLSDTGY